MATIPTYGEWMKATELGPLHPRSTKLKAVDKALERYGREPANPAAVQALWNAWLDWTLEKRDWKSSQRNRNGYLENFDDLLRRQVRPKLSQAEKDALEVMNRARMIAFQRLFQARPEVRWKKLDTAVEAKQAMRELVGTAASLTQVAGDSSTAATNFRAVDGFVASCFGEANAAVVKPILRQVVGADVVASLVPVLGQFSGAAKVLYSWGQAANAKYEEVSIKNRRFIVGGAGTDAERAFQALGGMLDGVTREAVVDAMTGTVTFAARSLLALADGGAISGPLVGAAESVANVAKKIKAIGDEYRETKLANQLIREGKLDFHLVEAYPLLGCYMLTCCDFSDVLNMGVLEFGANGWKDRVLEVKKRHIDPVREKARGFIDASPFHVPGLVPRVGISRMDAVGKARAFVGV